jgi:hypothetical protein
MEVKFDPSTLRSLERAIARNPQTVKQEVATFLTRGIAVYNRGIIRSPWRMGMSGGGAPVDTRNLRDTHQREVSAFSARIFPTAKYADPVHKGRPWLQHVFDNSTAEINTLQDQLLQNVVTDLAR